MPQTRFVVDGFVQERLGELHGTVRLAEENARLFAGANALGSLAARLAAAAAGLALAGLI